MSSVSTRLLSGRVVAANTLWTLIGLIAPAVVGVAVIPWLVRGFGDERFAVLTLAWTVIGYFTLFDLGLGRAVTRQLSESLVTRDTDHIGSVLWTAWSLMLGLGLIGAAVGAL